MIGHFVPVMSQRNDDMEVAQSFTLWGNVCQLRGSTGE